MDVVVLGGYDGCSFLWLVGLVCGGGGFGGFVVVDVDCGDDYCWWGGCVCCLVVYWFWCVGGFCGFCWSFSVDCFFLGVLFVFLLDVVIVLV